MVLTRRFTSKKVTIMSSLFPHIGCVANQRPSPFRSRHFRRKACQIIEKRRGSLSIFQRADEYHSGSAVISRRSESRLFFRSLAPGDSCSSRFDTGTVLRSVLSVLAYEAKESRAGNQLVIDSLARILFVEVLRLCVAHEDSQKGWLGALVDTKIGAALAVMHRDVTKRLTLSHIATAVGMSRSSFALRFKVLVGQSPLDYRLQLNMQRAAQLLRNTSKTVSCVAYELGYDSEKSFGKAFKRVMGCPPTSYRETDTELCQR